MKSFRFLFCCFKLFLLLLLALADCLESGTLMANSNAPISPTTFDETPTFNKRTASDNRLKISAKFLPPDRRLIMFVGQDSDTISNYIQAVPEDNIEGITLYTALKSADEKLTLPAVYAPANWQAGTVNFSRTLSESPDAALAVGLAFDHCNQINHESNIANGLYDKTISKLGDYFKSLAPRKVFLRAGYEFDGPWNCYTPEKYVMAYRRIFDIIRKVGANNVASVWQSATWPDPTIAGNRSSLYDHRRTNMLSSWYPGDDYVDWVAMSVFYRDLSQWNYVPVDTPQAVQEKLLTFARARGKPVMIAETAPQSYRIGALTRSFIQLNQQTSTTAKIIWKSWYQPFFDFVNDNRDVIRAVAYINTHWEMQPMWQCTPGVPAGRTGCNNGNWGDSRVQANSFILERWLKQVNDKARWIQTGSY